MAFDKLKHLGEEKFTKILNELIRGTAAMAVARLIQQEWKDLQSTPEKTLTQQLNRLRFAAAEGMFGKKIAQQLEAGHTVTIPALDGVSIPVLARMEELAEIQRTRMINIVKKESALKEPLMGLTQATNEVFTTYSTCLKDIQKLRYEMGLDEFKGAVPVRGVQSSATLPDGTNVQQQVFEALMSVEKIFERRGIAKVLPEA